MMGFGMYGGQMRPFFDPGPTNRRTDCDWGENGHSKQLRIALQWVDSLGVRIPKSGRHNQYLRFLEKVEGSEGTDFYIRNSREIDYARYEVHEFDRIRRWLQEKYDSNIKQQLTDYMSGPYRYTLEDKSSKNTRARDVGLELAIGSEFASIELAVQYGDPLYPEPMLTIENEDYAIQCKRASSSTERSLIKKLDAASRQIRRNCADHPSVSGGAVILDLTKTLNPSGSIHVNESNQPQFCSMRERHYEITKLCERLMKFDKFDEVALLIIRATYLQSHKYDGLANQWVCSKKYIPNPNNKGLYEALDRASPIQFTTGVGFGAVL